MFSNIIEYVFKYYWVCFQYYWKRIISRYYYFNEKKHLMVSLFLEALIILGNAQSNISSIASAIDVDTNAINEKLLLMWMM